MGRITLFIDSFWFKLFSSRRRSGVSTCQVSQGNNEWNSLWEEREEDIKTGRIVKNKFLCERH